MSQTADRTQLERALAAIRDMRARVERAEKARSEPVAVVGMACRLPGGANSPDQFWDLLLDGKDATGPMPDERWSMEDYFDPDPEQPGRIYTRGGGFLDQLDQFDGEFFGMSPREARKLDPQQRMLLECTWQALEDAAIAPESIARSNTGVFVGISATDFSRMLSEQQAPEAIDMYSGSGSGSCFAAGRLSYFFGLSGPALSIDTACSSSLTAIDNAVHYLRAGSCDMAIAAGVNVMLSPDTHIYLCKARALSPDGRCKTFDASADGYGRGEGCGVVLLKPLSKAQADGDRIVALIHGSASNNDGRSSAITVPNGEAQRAVIEAAVKDAQIDPARYHCVEAHGTGTQLGDPIEIHAICQALGDAHSQRDPVVVGSVKSNLGHLEAAAGVTGFIKTAMMVSRGQIPPTLHVKTPNPNVAWNELPVTIATEARPWPGQDYYAGVSAFGFSGTNVHVVLGPPPPVTPVEPSTPADTRRTMVLPLAARSSSGLAMRAEQLADRLKQVAPEDLCYSAARSVPAFPWRAVIAGSTRDSLSNQLKRLASNPQGANVETVDPRRVPRLGLVITSLAAPQQRQQHQQLVTSCPSYRAQVARLEAELEATLPVRLEHLLEGRSEQLTGPRAAADLADLLLHVASARWLETLGLNCAAVVGHGSGELVAAVVAGVIAVPDAAALVNQRAALIASTPEGAGMIEVASDAVTTLGLIQSKAPALAVAAINGPTSTVISGAEADLGLALEAFAASQINTRRLPEDRGLHGPFMDALAGSYRQALEKIALAPARKLLISSVTGNLAGAEVTSVDYWAAQLRSPVKFAAALHSLSEQNIDLVLTLGGQPQWVSEAQDVPDPARPALKQAEVWQMDQDGWASLSQLVGQAWQLGVPVDWQEYWQQDWQGTPVQPIAMPAYPFERKRLWFEKAPDAGGNPRKVSRFPGKKMSSPALSGTVYELDLAADNLGFLTGHQVFGQQVFPAAGYVELGLKAASEALNSPSVTLTGLRIEAGLVVDPDAAEFPLQTIVTHDGPGQIAFRICSRSGAAGVRDGWVTHAQGSAGTAAGGDQNLVPTGTPAPINQWQEQATESLSLDQIYGFFQTLGLDYRGPFRCLKQLRRNADFVLAEVGLPAAGAIDHAVNQAVNQAKNQAPYLFHPALLDGAFQAMAGLWAEDFSAAAETTFLPVSIDQIQLTEPATETVWIRIDRQAIVEAENAMSAGFEVFSPDGRRLLTVSGFGAQSVHLDQLRQSMQGASQQPSLFEIEWQPAAEAAPGKHGHWLLLAADASRLAPVQSVLAAAGANVHVADVGDADGLHSALKALGDRGQDPSTQPPQELLYLLPGSKGDGDPDELRQGFEVLQALAAAAGELANNPRLSLLSIDGVISDTGAIDPVSAGHRAMGLALAAEQPALNTQLIDLTAADLTHPAPWLPTLTREARGDHQLCVRDGQVRVARLKPLSALASRGFQIKSDASYVVTGGLGGIGLEICRWLLACGAGRLVICGRRELDPSIEAQLSALRTEAANGQVYGQVNDQEDTQAVAHHGDHAAAQDPIHYLAADLSDADSVAQLITAAHSSDRPLTGIFHAAGVLDDGLLADQSWDRIWPVLAAKACAAQHLVEQVRQQHLTLDCLVLFSSISSVFGAAAQTGYAAANAWLDALAVNLRRQNVPALSVNWGPWGQVGMAARGGAGLKARIAQQGLKMLTPEHAISLLGQLLDSHHSQAVGLSFDWEALARRSQLPAGLPPLFQDLLPEDVATAKPVAGTATFIDDTSDETRLASMVLFIQQSLAAVLDLPDGELPPANESLLDMGIDSLMGVELRNRIVEGLGVEVDPASMLEADSIDGLSAIVLQEYRAVTGAAAGPDSAAGQDAGGGPDAGQDADRAAQEELLDGLSEAEMDGLLTSLMDKDGQ